METSPDVGKKFSVMGTAEVRFEAYPNRQAHLVSMPAIFLAASRQGFGGLNW